MTIPLALVVTRVPVQELAESALPNAPIVPDPPARHPVLAARTSLARGLHAVAAAIAPAA